MFLSQRRKLKRQSSSSDSDGSSDSQNTLNNDENVNDDGSSDSQNTLNNDEHLDFNGNVLNEQELPIDSDINENDSDSDDSDSHKDSTDCDETMEEDHLWSIGNEISSVTTNGFCVLLLSISRKHNLTDVALGSLLRLFRSVLPENNNVPAKPATLRNLSKWKSKINNLTDGQTFERRCTECQKLIVCTNVESTWICRNGQCKLYNVQQCISEYISCPIMPQCKMIVEAYGSNILKHLQLTKEHALNTGNVSDITNGAKYLSMLSPNPDGRKLKISLISNTDGARPVNGRGGSIWPGSAIIAELPPKLRCAAWNVVTLAFYYGRGKPNWEHFVKKNITELQKLLVTPFNVVINGDRYEVYVTLYCSIFDLVAKCAIWCMKQFNGEDACMDCTNPGIVVGKVRRWPYVDNVECKDNDFYKNVYGTLEAEERETGRKPQPLFGVFKKSELCSLLDPATDSPIDFMHNVYEGFFSKILLALFAKQLPGKRLLFFNATKIALLDAFIKKVIWPSEFHRKIPSLKLVKQFKASESKNCMLYCLLPLLFEYWYVQPHVLIPPEVHNFMHFLAIYVEIARVLVSDTISQIQLDTVEQLSVKLNKLIPFILHKDEETFNAHCTVHLTKYARLYGPLHGISAFVFESLNHVYCRLASGNKGTLQQIQNRALEQKIIEYWIKKHADQDTELSHTIRYVIRNATKQKSFEAAVVEICDREVPQEERDIIPFETYQTAFAIEYKRTLFECDQIRRKTRCNFVAKIEHADYTFVKIRRFFFNDEGAFVFTAIPLKIDNRLIDYIEKIDIPILNTIDINEYGNFHFVVHEEDHLKCFNISALQSVCVFMKFDTFMYVTPLAHMYEHD